MKWYKDFKWQKESRLTLIRLRKRESKNCILTFQSAIQLVAGFHRRGQSNIQQRRQIRWRFQGWRKVRLTPFYSIERARENIRMQMDSNMTGSSSRTRSTELAKWPIEPKRITRVNIMDIGRTENATEKDSLHILAKTLIQVAWM